jgi:hypothetical protein
MIQVSQTPNGIRFDGPLAYWVSEAVATNFSEAVKFGEGDSWLLVPTRASGDLMEALWDASLEHTARLNQVFPQDTKQALKLLKRIEAWK